MLSLAENYLFQKIESEINNKDTQDPYVIKHNIIFFSKMLDNSFFLDDLNALLEKKEKLDAYCQKNHRIKNIALLYKKKRQQCLKITLDTLKDEYNALLEYIELTYYERNLYNVLVERVKKHIKNKVMFMIFFVNLPNDKIRDINNDLKKRQFQIYKYLPEKAFDIFKLYSHQTVVNLDFDESKELLDLLNFNNETLFEFSLKEIELQDIDKNIDELIKNYRTKKVCSF